MQVEVVSSTREQSTLALSTQSGIRKYNIAWTIHFKSSVSCYTSILYEYRVCHIAGELLKGLAEVHKIDDDDILCVQIAALCHDLGKCQI